MYLGQMGPYTAWSAIAPYVISEKVERYKPPFRVVITQPGPPPPVAESKYTQAGIGGLFKNPIVLVGAGLLALMLLRKK